MINIQNIYHMLAYAFRALAGRSYESIASEKFEHSTDLLAAILAKGIANQVRKGLGKEYIDRTESLSSPRGKIDIPTSMRLPVTQKSQLVCEFDEFSENTYINQILKAVSIGLIRSPDVSLKRKKALKKTMLFFHNVDLIDLSGIQWFRINYHRHNATCKMLIYICQLLVSGLLPTVQQGTKKWEGYMDDQSMHKLYEKFVLEYYRRHYPYIKVSSSYIDWNEGSGMQELLPSMKSDIMLEYYGKTLIIDTKYYGRAIQVHPMYGSQKLYSRDLYQIFAYVKNKDVHNAGNVSGLLLYAKTDEQISPNNSYVMSGNRISAKTLDLNADFSVIQAQLNSLAQHWLSSFAVNNPQ